MGGGSMVAAYAALVSVMNNIEQMIDNPRVSSYLNKEQIQIVFEKAGLLLSIIEGNKYGSDRAEAEAIKRDVTDAAHRAEDGIESLVVDQILARSSVDNDRDTTSSFMRNVQKRITKEMKKVQHLKRRMACAGAGAAQSHTARPLPLPSIIKLLDDVVKRATRLQYDEAEEQPTQSRSTKPLMDQSGGETAAMVGLDAELTNLLHELTGNQSNRHTISIAGMGGTGKTTLAKNVFSNPLIKECFDIRAWVTISQQYTVEEILSQLLSSLGKLMIGGNVVGLGEHLHKTLKSGRYLIVLDDIWSVKAWDEVRRYFPDDGNSSRVVLTTRLSNVANACASTCFTMNLLDEDKSWKLFCEKAVFPHKDDPLQLVGVGKEIVRLCKGLALSIVVVGGLLLKSPRTVKFWENVAEGLKSSPYSQRNLDVLSLSYNELPLHLKPCFLYMGVFSEDSKIRASTLTKLWVAEGFIKLNSSKGDLEEIAEGYLNDLIDRNLILLSGRRYNGKVGSCGIHDLLRDLCIKIGLQEETFIHVSGEYNDDDPRRRRLVLGSQGVVDFSSQLARSIFTVSGTCIRHLKCELLRVLGNAKIADGKDFNFSPEVLYKNVNLRYLAYQHPLHYGHEWKLPTYVSHLWNLQTLILTPPRVWSYPLVVAPPVIWEMRQLRHLKFPEIYLPPPSDQQVIILENLMTLGAAVDLQLSERVCAIIPNIKKLRLIYDQRCYWPGYYGRRFDGGLHFLDQFHNDEGLHFLDQFHKLESLKMKMEVTSPMKFALPVLLKKLSLSHCQLHWKDLGMIGSLLHLQVLYLETNSVTGGTKWSPADGQFLHLKWLKIEECELIHWFADSSHFPVLEKLILCRLGKLKEIPLDIGEIPTLGLIRVEHCSKSTATSARRIKKDQLENQGNDAIQIEILM